MKLRVRGSAGDGYDYLGSLTLVRGDGGSLNGIEILFAGGQFKDGEVMYFEADHLGSIRAVINSDGETVATNNYMPFGGRHTGGVVNDDVRYRFNGKEEQTTGSLNLLDYGARMYDPETGRWFVIDPLTEKYPEVSPYVYCNNNPIMFIDPDGREWTPDKFTQDIVKEVNKGLDSKISAADKNIGRLEKKITKAESKGKETSGLQGKLDSAKANKANLETSKQEFNAMGEVQGQLFSFAPSGSNSGGNTDFDASGTIVMKIVSGEHQNANAVHEGAHGYELWKNGEKPKSEAVFSSEINAYSRQFSYSPTSMPASDVGGVPKGLQDINKGWVYGISGGPDDFIYPYAIKANGFTTVTGAKAEVEIYKQQYNKRKK